MDMELLSNKAWGTLPGLANDDEVLRLVIKNTTARFAKLNKLISRTYLA